MVTRLDKVLFESSDKTLKMYWSLKVYRSYRHKEQKKKKWNNYRTNVVATVLNYHKKAKPVKDYCSILPFTKRSKTTPNTMLLFVILLK